MDQEQERTSDDNPEANLSQDQQIELYALLSSSTCCNDEPRPRLTDTNEDISEKYITRLPNGIKYVHININGLKSKFAEINDLLINENNILVLAVTETK